MNAPVTVLIPTRGRLPLLRRALAAVWDQDHTGPVHALVVFDEDLPSDPDLPAPHHPERQTLTVVRNGGRAGLAGLRNFALGLVETDWLATCDDDDVWLPHRLSSQLALAERHPATPLVGGGIRIVRHGVHVVRRPPRQVVTFADLLDDRIAELHPSTMLLRRDAVRAVDGWDEQIPGGQGEDYDLLLRVARDVGPLRLVPEVVADISWDGQSYFFDRWHTTADALAHLLAKFPEFAASPAGRARLLGQLAFAQAAAGRRRAALGSLRAGLADRPTEPRLALSVLVLTGLVRAHTVQALLHRRGRGI